MESHPADAGVVAARQKVSVMRIGRNPHKQLDENSCIIYHKDTMIKEGNLCTNPVKII